MGSGLDDRMSVEERVSGSSPMEFIVRSRLRAASVNVMWGS